MQALIIAEMAATLERNKSTIKDGNLQEFAELKTDTNKSTLLRHADTLAEKLILQSMFTDNLFKLQKSYKKKHRTGDTKTMNSLQATADLTVTHAHINYLIHVSWEKVLYQCAQSYHFSYTFSSFKYLMKFSKLDITVIQKS